jgi:hypothetical protein
LKAEHITDLGIEAKKNGQTSTQNVLEGASPLPKLLERMPADTLLSQVTATDQALSADQDSPRARADAVWAAALHRDAIYARRSRQQLYILSLRNDSRVSLELARISVDTQPESA